MIERQSKTNADLESAALNDSMLSANNTPVSTGDGPLIFLSVAESSADLHAANLIRAVQLRAPSIRFMGVAGPQSTAAGCQPVFDMTQHAGMLLGIFGSAKHGLQMFRAARTCLRQHPFDAAIVVDSPLVHLRLARYARSLNIPVLYYIAPQLWAWGAGRIRKMRRCVDRAAVILPFEEDYFRKRGVNAKFVGHPLADVWRSQAADNAEVDRKRSAGKPFIALLPGSRKHVVEEVMPGQIEVVEAITAAMPHAEFGVSVANRQVAPIISRLLAGQRSRVATFPSEGYTELIQAADLVLVASGTSTLDVAFHGRPMIVMYNSSRVMYNLIGRWMIRTKYLSLPNILAGREIVPEFMPCYKTTRPIAERALALLGSEEARRRMTDELARIVEPLRSRHASDETAAMLLEMLQNRR